MEQENNLKTLLQKLQNQTQEKYILPEQDLLELLKQAKTIFKSQKNIVHLTGPINVVGNTHGHFIDLQQIFQKGGFIQDNNQTKYCFLGNYIDRGADSVECIEYLLTLMVLYPQNVTLLRGNHETPEIGKIYGFYEELKTKYTSNFDKIFDLFQEVFVQMPAAAIINQKVLCVHGGLSPQLPTLQSIEELDRTVPLQKEGGPYVDLLWSDPSNDIQEFSSANPRGAGQLFGKKAVEDFLKVNNLDLIVRSHQLVDSGFRYDFEERLLTTFSAPNYCYRCKNQASFVRLGVNLEREVVVFTASQKQKIDEYHSEQ